jgi:lipopolysaccharide export system permease protein
MFIFTRYVVAEILKIFLLTLIAITLMVTVGMAVKEGASRGCPPLVILQLMPYMLPEMFVITIPVSLLLATSIVYGRMTGSNEIVAMKSLGISPMDVMWPTIILSLIFSIAVLYLQEVAATVGRPNVIRVVAKSSVDIAYGMLQKEKYCGLPEFSITVRGVRLEDRMLIDPIIEINGQEKLTIRADRAKLETDSDGKSINIYCWNSRIDYKGKGVFGIRYPGMFKYSINPGDPTRDQYHRDWVAMHEIPDRLAELRKLVAETMKEQKALMEKKLAAPPQSAEEQAKDEELLTNANKKIKNQWWLIYRLQTEPYRRLSNGFTCLCFVLIGAPVAMLWRHTDILTNFFVCFLPILAIYYPLLMIGEDLSTSGKLWPISFWMGNVILFIPGLFLLRWVIRH